MTTKKMVNVAGVDLPVDSDADAALEAAETANRSRPIRGRGRRSRAEIQRIRGKLFELLDVENPMTVRQLFYRMVSLGEIEKTEQEYKGTIVRLLGDLRRERVIPFSWIADNTRWQRKPRTFSSLESALDITARTYRRALWDEQDAYVEIWLEKDALSGVLYDVTSEFDVPLMVTRGYPSLSYLHSAAEAYAELGKPVFLYYFGDYDPSGLDITRAVEEGLRELAPEVDITFERIAVTEDQIDEFDLPTRPTKKTDSRAKTFDGESVEVDAIPVADLKRIARDAIEAHVDQEQLDRLLTIEAEERAIVRGIALTYAATPQEPAE